jgi:hypothetical protein
VHECTDRYRNGERNKSKQVILGTSWQQDGWDPRLLVDDWLPSQQQHCHIFLGSGLDRNMNQLETALGRNMNQLKTLQMLQFRCGGQSLGDHSRVRPGWGDQHISTTVSSPWQVTSGDIMKTRTKDESMMIRIPSRCGRQIVRQNVGPRQGTGPVKAM